MVKKREESKTSQPGWICFLLFAFSLCPFCIDRKCDPYYRGYNSINRELLRAITFYDRRLIYSPSLLPPPPLPSLCPHPSEAQVMCPESRRLERTRNQRQLRQELHVSHQVFTTGVHRDWTVCPSWLVAVFVMLVFKYYEYHCQWQCDTNFIPG